MNSTIPIHRNIKSAPASPGRSRVGPALYVFSLLGVNIVSVQYTSDSPFYQYTNTSNPNSSSPKSSYAHAQPLGDFWSWVLFPHWWNLVAIHMSTLRTLYILRKVGKIDMNEYSKRKKAIGLSATSVSANIRQIPSKAVTLLMLIKNRRRHGKM
jgi:hypothetical protein